LHIIPQYSPLYSIISIYYAFLSGIYVEGLFENYDWVNMPGHYGCSDVGKGNGTIFNHPYRVTEEETAIGVPASGGSP